MSPLRTYATYWHVGGEIITSGGVPVAGPAARLAWHFREAESSEGVGRDYHERCAAELTEALAAQARWAAASRVAA